MPEPDPGDPRTTFGANLRTAREAAGLSQEALGHRADFHPTEVNRIERGRRNPGLLTIIKLAEALGIPAGAVSAVVDPHSHRLAILDIEVHTCGRGQ